MVRRTLIATAAVLLGALSTGCTSLIGDQEIDARFRVDPRTDGSFFGWSEVTVDDDPNSVDSVTLQWVTMRANDPPNSDLRFIAQIIGEAVKDDESELLVSKNGFPEGEPEVSLDKHYEGDLRPLFRVEDKTIRIEWRGTINPDFNEWPENGFEIGVKASIHLE
jgi:hypothetical protein